MSNTIKINDIIGEYDNQSYEVVNITCGPVKNSWVISLTNGSKVIRHYQTDVIIFKDKSIVLNNGGWQSATTKKLMNSYLREYGYSIAQKNYEWLINGKPYKNGMTIKTGVKS